MTDDHVIVASPEVVIGSPERDILVKPIVQLQKVDLSNNEDEEKELYKMRAKLYRWFVDDEEGGMWKERGVGDVRILKNEKANTSRVLMRRDKTLKLCLNHFIISNMEIKDHASNDKALLWSTPADYADGESKPETLCIRFGKSESAVDFKAKFEECATGKCDKKDDTAKLADKLSGLEVKEEKDKNDNTTTDSNDNNTQVNGEKHENQDSKEEKKDSESNDKE